MDEIPNGPLVTAGSWDIATRILAAHPRMRIFETHPAGGMYDCLTLHGRGAKIDINRVGSIHVHESPGGEKIGLIPDQEWKSTLLVEGGSQILADRVLKFCQMPADKPSVTPWLISYRVIARALASRVFDRAWWDARQQFEDTAGYGGGNRWPVPSAEMAMIPSNMIWVLTRGDDPVAWLWDGWAWTLDRSRIDLVAAYHRGARVDDLAAALTARTTKATAASLPGLPRYPDEQPIEEWWTGNS